MTALFEPRPSSAAGWLLDVLIPGDPMGAARPRVRVIPGAGPAGKGVGQAYMPKAHVEAEMGAMILIRHAWRGQPPLDAAVRVELDVVIARPGRLCRRKDPIGRLWCCSKPDADNVAKLMLDAMTKAGVVVDDTRVVQLVVAKQYCSILPLEQPHVRIRLQRLGDTP